MKKYYSLTKEEKIKLKEKFYQTNYGRSLQTRLNRLLITGVLGIIFSIILFIFPSNIWDIVTGIILVMASLIFIIGSFTLRVQKINDYLIKQKK